MRFKLGAVAALVMMAGLGPAQSQTSPTIGAPRELPPASFSGQHYVDSRGCLFLRAGSAARTTWVPRIGRDRAPLCGYQPTFGTNQVVMVESAPRRNQAALATGSGKIGCYSDAPVAERFRVVGGGSMVLCTRGDGNLQTARVPLDLTGAGGAAPSGTPSPGRESRTAPVVSASPDYRTPPKGFKRAWEDDRLNPNRAIGTSAGWAAQDRIWTRETPARLVEAPARR